MQPGWEIPAVTLDFMVVPYVTSATERDLRALEWWYYRNGCMTLKRIDGPTTMLGLQ